MSLGSTCRPTSSTAIQSTSYTSLPTSILLDLTAVTNSTGLARSLAIEVKEVPVEAHCSVGKVERYHSPLRRAYGIIKDEMKDEQIEKEMVLQMAVKL